MATNPNANKKDLIQAVRFYVDKIVSDPTIGGNFFIHFMLCFFH